MGVVLVSFSASIINAPSSGAYGCGNPAIWPTACATSSCRSSSWWRATLWYYAYQIRNKLLDEIRRDYVLLARAKGLGGHGSC